MMSESMKKAIEMVRGGSSVSAAAKRHRVQHAWLCGACDALGFARPKRGRKLRAVQSSTMVGKMGRVLITVGDWRYVRTDRSVDGVITLTEATKGEYDAQE